MASSKITGSTDNVQYRLKLFSFNMHGFNQGFTVIENLIKEDLPDLLLVQEHWLTPGNLYKFENFFPEYFFFGCSAMDNQVASGILRGRPFGGVAALIHKRLRSVTETIHCEERFCIVRVANYFIVNVYLPCVGTPDRFLICQELFQNVLAWYDRYRTCECVITGDLNVDLDGSDIVAAYVSGILRYNSLVRCDSLFRKSYTYVNNALDHKSCIDYIVVSSPSSVIDFGVLDPDVNYSDHLPLTVTLACPLLHKAYINSKGSEPIQTFLRWDKADRQHFYDYTGSYIAPLIDELDNIMALASNCSNKSNFDIFQKIDSVYNTIVSILHNAAEVCVPRAKKNFYKYWWSEELTILKQNSIDTNRIWKAAGKPRYGRIFDNRQSCRLIYRKRLREEQNSETYSYTNALHDALLTKNDIEFWKCWRSKFGTSNKCTEVEGCVDSAIIASKFADYFSSSYTCNNKQQAHYLHEQYLKMRSDYCGLSFDNDHLFDTELISKTIYEMKKGKAPDIEGLSVEHLSYSHPSLPFILSKFFRLIFFCRYVPVGFRKSYIVPIPKPKDCRSKSMKYDDFRGITISPVISKIFEYCLMNGFQRFLTSGDNQFGFKKGLGCRNAVYAARNIVDQFIKGGNTANLCAIDMSKAFDKINHHALFVKLMKRHVPIEFLEMLENWLYDSQACVKWNSLWSYVFRINFGVRQGSVLSPVLFAIYVDDVARCGKNERYLHIILYADDILLLAPSVTQLEKLLRKCEEELSYLDMAINNKKSACLRVGPRYDVRCKEITTSAGNSISWTNQMRYLGVFIVKSRVFKCDLDHAKRSFYRAVNAIFGRIGRIASEEVIIQLTKSKCIPVLIYGLEVCPLTKSDLKSLDFPVNRFFMKLFKTRR